MRREDISTLLSKLNTLAKIGRDIELLTALISIPVGLLKSRHLLLSGLHPNVFNYINAIRTNKAKETWGYYALPRVISDCITYYMKVHCINEYDMPLYVNNVVLLDLSLDYLKYFSSSMMMEYDYNLELFGLMDDLVDYTKHPSTTKENVRYWLSKCNPRLLNHIIGSIDPMDRETALLFDKL